VSLRAVTLVCILAAGCTSIRLAQGSREAAYPGPAVTRILVAATAEDESMRGTLESEVVARLAGSGVRAFAAHHSLPLEAPADGPALDALANRLGAEAILTVRLTLGTRIEPPSVKVTVVPAVTYWGSPRAAGRAPYTSYTRTNARPIEEARLDASLRKATGENVIWSASTEPFAPKDLPRATGDFADLVVRALRQLPTGRSS
jgi:hypothetical protein